MKKFYLYKLWVTGYKDFYIGVTENADRRRIQHCSSIYSLLRPLKLNKKVKASHSAHIILALKLLTRKSIIQICPELKDRINFKIINEATTCQEINKMETEALVKYSADPYCLNIDRSSRYNPTIKQYLTNKVDHA